MTTAVNRSTRCNQAPRAFHPSDLAPRPNDAVHVKGLIREMGGAPRNPALRNHLLAWIVKPSGCHCKDALGGKTTIVECRPLLGALPLSPTLAVQERPLVVVEVARRDLGPPHSHSHSHSHSDSSVSDGSLLDDFLL